MRGSFASSEEVFNESLAGVSAAVDGPPWSDPASAFDSINGGLGSTASAVDTAVAAKSDVSDEVSDPTFDELASG